MIRLRHDLHAALGHPVAGPLLLLLLALLLSFVFLHALEHGLEGALLMCVMLIVVGLRLFVAQRTRFRPAPAPASCCGRAPPGGGVRLLVRAPLPAAGLAIPLRR